MKPKSMMNIFMKHYFNYPAFNNNNKITNNLFNHDYLYLMNESNYEY
jgi:hypothetical protein